MQGELFVNDEALRPRDKHGRFATKERAYADRILVENQRLQAELARYKHLYEKYFMAWKACVTSEGNLKRKLIAIKEMCHGKGTAGSEP